MIKQCQTHKKYRQIRCKDVKEINLNKVKRIFKKINSVRLMKKTENGNYSKKRVEGKADNKTLHFQFCFLSLMV
jgi:hypothetical protein